MKELEKHETIKEQVVKEQPAPEKKVRFLGRIKVHKGHKWWKLDTETKEIEIHEPTQTAKLVDGKVKVTKSITRNGDRYVYVQALNKKNAIKKFAKYGYKI